MAKEFEEDRPIETQDTNVAESSNEGINSFMNELYSPAANCKNASDSGASGSGTKDASNEKNDDKSENGESKGINLGELRKDPLKSQWDFMQDNYFPGEKVKVDDNLKDLSPKEMAESMTKNGKMDAATENTLARAQRDGKLDETLKAINDELRKSGSPYHLQVEHDSHEWRDPHRVYPQPYPVPRGNPDGRTTTVTVSLHDREKVMDTATVSKQVDVYRHGRPYDIGRPVLEFGRPVERSNEYRIQKYSN